MSRKAANEKFNWKDVNRFLKQQGVTLISAGLDETVKFPKKFGAPGVIRTRDPLLRRQLLYPSELRAHFDL